MRVADIITFREKKKTNIRHTFNSLVLSPNFINFRQKPITEMRSKVLLYSDLKTFLTTEFNI